jgi:aspartate aminotransferase-like enzyme
MSSRPTSFAPVDAQEYAATECAFAELLGTQRECLILQGEAILALEAAARGLGRPGSRALNVVTSPYGALFGHWLRQGGAEVEDLTVDLARAVPVEGVADALGRGSFDVVSLVHAEAASGVVNPLREIAELVRDSGALLAVDAVASVGAEPLDLDAWGLDVVVVSAQKALAGPTGAAAVFLSERAWEWIEHNPEAPRRSVLSLLDWRDLWLEPGRRVLPVIPHHAEMRLLAAALEEASATGIDSVIDRHRAARDATRRGLRGLGVEPFVAADEEAAAVATTVRTPLGLETPALLAAAAAHLPTGGELLVSAAPAAPAVAIRVNHTGRLATIADVEAAISAIGRGLRDLTG